MFVVVSNLGNVYGVFFSENEAIDWAKTAFSRGYSVRPIIDVPSSGVEGEDCGVRHETKTPKVCAFN